MSRIGGQPLRALTEFGYAGAVYPVNPKYETLKNLVCYPNITAVPQPCDVAIIAVPSTSVAGVIEECGAAGVSFAIILSAGFREIGKTGAILQDELVAAARRSRIRVIGPNCQGLMNLRTRMYGGFGTAFQNPSLQAGPLAMVTQSGGFGFGVATEVAAASIGFNYIVSTGNEADVNALDLLEFFLEQDDVEVVTTYLEGIKDGRRLLALGERALELGKPILVWKVGNSGSGRRAAVSHTANLTSGPEFYRAAFREGGFIEIREAANLMDAARAFLSRRLPRGRNVAVLTSSGGVGVLLADRCEERELHLPELSETTKNELRKFMPEYAALSNPIDVTGQLRADAASMNRAVSVLLQDPEIDQVIIRKGSTVGNLGREWATNLIEVADKSDKPILISVLSDRSEETLEILNRHRLAWSPTPSGAVFGAAALYEFVIKTKRYSKREKRTFPRQEIDWPAAAATLGEHRSKQLLAAYGIPAVREVLLSTEAVAKLTHAPVPFPLAVKVESPDIPHKTEADSVRLGITNLAELRKAAVAVVAAARKHDPRARIEGVLLQEMAVGVEMMLGVVNDVFFGPVVALGLGGIFAETLRDVTHRCAPIDISTAHVMIEELQGGAVLRGVRGRSPADIDSLAETISRLSFLAADHADRIQEIDVNPLFVRPARQGVVAADALIVVKSPAAIVNTDSAVAANV
ncbi:MAG: acetate--CoA ligase family protein [Betaproteobacteria bacterium]|nr:acetate--CoA ligase family protein [Betaproteobacteria bacterium]